jgi:hypothetical protein
LALRSAGHAEGDLFTVKARLSHSAQRTRSGSGTSIAARYASREAWAVKLVDGAARLVDDRLMNAVRES